jgi:hypothetical protein
MRARCAGDVRTCGWPGILVEALVHMTFACYRLTPWPGDPRVNIHNDKGKAKAYQVRQVLKAIDKKEGK